MTAVLERIIVFKHEYRHDKITGQQRVSVLLYASGPVECKFGT